MTASAVVIPFVQVAPAQNPNVAVRTKEDGALPYYRAMVVALSSAARFNPHVGLQLVTDRLPPEPFLSNLARLGVEIRISDFAHRPPKGFAPRFEGSLYLVDALSALTADCSLMIDPDVLIVRGLDPLFEETRHRVGILPLDYAFEHSVNGLSRAGAVRAYSALDGYEHSDDRYFGGEVYALPKDGLAAVQERAQRAAQYAFAEFMAGRDQIFFTEEHLMNYAVRSSELYDLGSEARRIWTARRVRTVRGDERQLSLWHLPAEKDRGFSSLYPVCIDASSWFWKGTEEEFRSHAGRALGLFNRRPSRLAVDTAGFLYHRLSKWRQR